MIHPRVVAVILSIVSVGAAKPNIWDAARDAKTARDTAERCQEE